MKRIISVLICSAILLGSIPSTSYAFHGSSDYSIGEIGGYLSGNQDVVERMQYERRFRFPGGHGFCAEEGNNLIDRIHGQNATVVGGDNAKDGADRLIINRDGALTWIQDKYYSTATESVEAAFDSESGMYRYLDNSGKPMQLEVPSDQYDKAVEQFARRIEEGKVEGVTDPEEAKNIIRKGRLSYQQAKNIAKAGNIDSLKYDAANGAVVAVSAMGIGFVLDYAVCKINGYDDQTALREASLNGIKTGGVVFATYVISQQLAKAGVTEMTKPVADMIARNLGENVAKALAQASGVATANITAEELTKKISEILQNEIVVAAVLTVVLSIDDVYDLFSGRISKDQFLNTLVVTGASVAGATVGSMAGGALGTILPGGVGVLPGKFVGGIVGGKIFGGVASNLMKKRYEGDAQKMYEIISAEFEKMSIDYMIDKEEGDKIVSKLQGLLTEKRLKEMYKSDDREAFANNLMTPLFDEIAASRGQIITPSADRVRYEMKNDLQGMVAVH